jgi:molybdate transport system regulatory protein
MSRTRAPCRPKQTPLTPHVKVWLEIDGRYAFGLGITEILQAVQRAGSIKEAAANLGKSYRHVWGRLKQAEQVLGRQLVETRVGGQGTQRSSLTPAARELVTAFLTFRRRMAHLAEVEFQRHFT